MTCTIYPSVARGTVTAPPSKSMAHRLLLCGGLANGESSIHNISLSEDIQATLDCLSALGATYSYDGKTVKISGCNPETSSGGDLFCRECGSTLRFFLPLCLLSGATFHLRGSERLLSRPMSVYQNLCTELGMKYEFDGEQITVKGRLTGGRYVIPGNVSSQFISGLLFALPLTGTESVISITGKIESRSYVEITRLALKEFGISVIWQNENTLLIPKGQRCRCRDITVEGDYSNAVFFEALRLFGGDISVKGLNPNSVQGDRVYRDIFPLLEGGTPTVSLADCPDLGPILMAVAAAKHGAVFTDTQRLKMKESDRGAVMAEELSKLGVRTEITDNRIVVFESKLHAPSKPLCGHNDHRIVMALAVLLSVVGGSITEAEAVNKSFPDFWQLFTRIGVEVKTDGDE